MIQIEQVTRRVMNVIVFYSLFCGEVCCVHQQLVKKIIEKLLNSFCGAK